MLTSVKTGSWRSAGQTADALLSQGDPKDGLPALVLLLRCKDVRIAGLSFLHSPSWTINPYACERLMIDGIYIHTSLKEARVGRWHRPGRLQGRAHRQQHHRDRRRCHRVLFHQLRARAALREHHRDQLPPVLGLQRLEILRRQHELRPQRDRGQLRDHRLQSRHRLHGYDGGYVENVVLSNLMIDCQRFDWFWWGDGDPIYFTIQRRSESRGSPAGQMSRPPARSAT